MWSLMARVLCSSGDEASRINLQTAVLCLLTYLLYEVSDDPLTLVQRG